MKVEVQMPKMGESLQEGTITNWLKKVGDKIERDEMILEISTDKVDTEVPAPVGGTLTEILAKENETVEVGTVIAIIDTEEGAVAKEAPKEEPKEAVSEPPAEPEAEEETAEDDDTAEDSGDTVDVVMPKMGESLQEGTITNWLKKVGDKIDRDEMILEISTDKVDTEVPAPVGGTLVEILAKENETVEVGEIIARISTGGGAPKAAPKKVKADTPKATEKAAPKKDTAAKEIPQIDDQKGSSIPRKSGDKFFSPLVRSIAEAESISLSELESISGSGLEGRITKDDLMQFLDNRAKGKSVTASSPKSVVKQEAHKAPAVKSPAPVAVSDDAEIIPMDRVRQIIADHMVYSKQTSAHVTSVAEADVTDIVRFRNAHKDAFLKDQGFKLTYTPFFAQAAVDGLKKFPMVNVSVDGTNIIRHRRIHLSFATALPDGNLIVPVIKNADSLSLSGLARSVYDLSTRARNKQLNPDDIQGGTFTITNVGTFGSLFGTPIINQPQVAIMGIGAIQKRPVVRQYDGEDIIVIRDMVYVSITYDHRVVDGMLAGQCLKAICDSLESMNDSTLNV